MSMFGTQRDVDAIAEYADASVRRVAGRGSLAPVSGRRGVNAWLYRRGATAATRSTRRPVPDQDEAHALAAGFDVARAAAVALAVACTGGALRLLRAAHPPAGATTVIVSIGLLHTVSELAALAAGVAVFCVTAYATNRLLGVPDPAWAAPR